MSEATLTGCLREIRTALGDNARAPKFIETVHRRGYRFIGGAGESNVESPKPELPPHAKLLAPMLVGRDEELEQLRRYLDRTHAGERKLVFLSGEAGIGKTTLLQAFTAQVEVDTGMWIGRGQCIEQYGAGEAYMPVLEALGRLCREPGGAYLIELLGQHAPTWLVQMPALLSDEELEALQRKVQGATQERMLREMAEAIEVLTAEWPLILTIEDLHWSDHATLELLSTLARRQERARLLVLGTYRPVDVIVQEHPLKGMKQELVLHGQCEELPLPYLTESAVAEYLAERFPDSPLPESLAGPVHQRTDGNPLFMVAVVDAVVAQGFATQTNGHWELQQAASEIFHGVPETLRQMVERQIERLTSSDRQVLEGASVAGSGFSAAVVAAGLGADTVSIEERCEELARQGLFIQADGTQEWPDGTVASQYRFLQALYQETLYDRIAAARRVHLHGQIGERLEAGYIDHTAELAAELAMHFERGRDYQRAVSYFYQAGKTAIQRSANVEAIGYLSKGLVVLQSLPDTPERVRHELTLQITLGEPLVATKGFGAPEVGAAYTRAQELCQQVGETAQRFRALSGLWQFHFARAELEIALQLAKQLHSLAQAAQGSVFLVDAHRALGMTYWHMGQFPSSLEHFEHGIQLYDAETIREAAQQQNSAAIYSAMFCRVFVALSLWFLGYPDQALKRANEALTLARELSHSFSLALALVFASVTHQCRRESSATQQRAEELIFLSHEEGFELVAAEGNMYRGWALVDQGQQEGLEQILQGLTTWRATGAEMSLLHFLILLAEAYKKDGQAEEGLSTLSEAVALVERTGERFYEAEVYRLKGEFLLIQESTQRPCPNSKDKAKQAEQYFLQAIEIAQQQQAKSLELHAATSLARLWQGQEKTAEACDLLAPVYNWFTEGFETKDLQEAKALLDELGG